ncbi:MAG TPA: Maf family protein [Abditibacteriaceae bacterium]|nr:Maf family protein [Abditibacteriaceae bacterium]
MKIERYDAELHSSSSARRAPDWQFFLASTSPRRAELLRTIGLPFACVPVGVEEPLPNAQDELEPGRFVERLAHLKAVSCEVNGLCGSGLGQSIILAADTVVWHKGRILNKPRDAADACCMLKRLRNETHRVLTGMALRVHRQDNDECFVAHEVTQVTFGDASDEWIERYVATDEPLDKAGAYAAQGRGAVLIERIEGDFWNVVGLPLARLTHMLAAIGAPLETWWR